MSERLSIVERARIQNHVVGKLRLRLFDCSECRFDNTCQILEFSPIQFVEMVRCVLGMNNKLVRKPTRKRACKQQSAPKRG
jgi:hypothetical protein